MFLTQIFSYWSRQIFMPGSLVRKKYQYFRDLLALDRYCLEKMAEIEEVYYRSLPCDYARVVRLCNELDQGVGNLIKSIIALNPLRYRVLRDYHHKVSFYLNLALSINEPEVEPPYVLGLDEDLSEELCGGKAMNLGKIKKEGFPTPHGFCVTTRVFNAIISANILRPRINDILSRISLERIDEFEKRCGEIRQLIMKAIIPDHVLEEIYPCLDKLGNTRLAIRSSAFGEDSDLSFAGQYKSLLRIEPSDFVHAYKQVLASKYSPRAMTYRIHAGLPDELLPMAVLVLEMMDAEESGVVYSSGVKDKDEMGIYIVTGSGDKLVSGQVKAREYFLKKSRGFNLSGDFPPYLEKLWNHARDLEILFGKAQDIEWVVNKEGELFLLQTRPLQAIKPDSEMPGLDLPVLARGEWASPGLTSGKIFVLESRDSVSKIPEGSIVVVAGIYPELTAAISLLGGVITREGSAASHFATIARESSVPVIINVSDALERFSNGQLVTLDGNRGIIHDGKAEPRRYFSGRKKTWFSQRMKKVLEHVSTLNLKDAGSEDFIPRNCLSMHDLIRFTHEMGVREMFALADRKGRGLYQAKILKLEIPLVFRVLNLENGLSQEGDARNQVFLDDVNCTPFLAMFSGMTDERIEWDRHIKHFDWEEFDKVSAGIFDPTKSSLLSSYGLLAGDYMHVLIRFGYHFVVVDSLLGEEKELNYIQFSFKGGGAGESQRVMRLEAIRLVFEEFGFNIDIRGDLLKAEYNRENFEETQKRLKVIGYVLGKTRLKDMSMNEEKIQVLAREYIDELKEILA